MIQTVYYHSDNGSHPTLALQASEPLKSRGAFVGLSGAKRCSHCEEAVGCASAGSERPSIRLNSASRPGSMRFILFTFLPPL